MSPLDPCGWVTIHALSTPWLSTYCVPSGPQGHGPCPSLSSVVRRLDIPVLVQIILIVVSVLWIRGPPPFREAPQNVALAEGTWQLLEGSLVQGDWKEFQVAAPAHPKFISTHQAMTFPCRLGVEGLSPWSPSTGCDGTHVAATNHSTPRCPELFPVCRMGMVTGLPAKLASQGVRAWNSVGTLSFRGVFFCVVSRGAEVSWASWGRCGEGGRGEEERPRVHRLSSERSGNRVLEEAFKGHSFS